MSEPISVAKVGDIAEDEAIVVPKERLGTIEDVAVFFSGGAYSALDDTCTHERTSLATGWIEDGVVECPLHAARFCLRDGKVLSLPATRDVATHEVVVDGDDVRVVPNPDRLA